MAEKDYYLITSYQPDLERDPILDLSGPYTKSVATRRRNEEINYKHLRTYLDAPFYAQTKRRL